MRRLFGYYRQFDELSPEEVSRDLLDRRDEELRRHPAQQPPLDLSGSAWHGPPHPEVINAATFALRRAVNAYPDVTPLRDAIAASHDVDPARVMVGHGAGELVRAALRAVAPTDEVEIVWPGWGLLPQLVTEAGGTPVPVAAPSGQRTAVLCRPERPDGRGPRARRRRSLADRRRGARGVPPRGRGPISDHPRIIHIRSFSKIHAMAGFRIGYAIVPEGGPDLTPVLGVDAPALAGGAVGGRERRRVRAAAPRQASGAARGSRPSSRRPGGGPFAWLELALPRNSRRGGSTSRRGIAWGDERFVRVTVQTRRRRSGCSWRCRVRRQAAPAPVVLRDTPPLQRTPLVSPGVRFRSRGRGRWQLTG